MSASELKTGGDLDGEFVQVVAQEEERHATRGGGGKAGRGGHRR